MRSRYPTHSEEVEALEVQLRSLGDDRNRLKLERDIYREALERIAGKSHIIPASAVAREALDRAAARGNDAAGA